MKPNETLWPDRINGLTVYVDSTQAEVLGNFSATTRISYSASCVERLGDLAHTCAVTGQVLFFAAGRGYRRGAL
jgi:hypothetical protein